MVYQYTTRIAFLGPKGSYSYIAAMQYANRYFTKIIKCSCQKFNDIFTLVESGIAEHGIVPIENSNSGLITEVHDLLLHTSLISVDEITIPIKHCILVSNYTIDINQIKIIYSHPQPIQQCSNFLRNFPKWKIIFCESSAVAMQIVAKLNKPNLAALGSIQGGNFYGLHALLKHNLSNFSKNKTRFVILKNKNIKTIDTSIDIKLH